MHGSDENENWFRLWAGRATNDITPLRGRGGKYVDPEPGLTGRMDETALSLGTVKQAPTNPGYAGLRLIR